MTTDQERPARFEDRLLAELTTVVEDRARRSEPTATPTGTTRVPRLVRPRTLALSGAAVGALAVAAAVVLPIATGTTSPAYAVTEHDSKVTVRINRFQDAAGLERRLRAAGIRADVTYVPGVKTCQPGRSGRPLSAGQLGVHADGRGLAFTIDRGVTAHGRTLVVETSTGRFPYYSAHGPAKSAHQHAVVVKAASFGLARGPVPPCVPR